MSERKTAYKVIEEFILSPNPPTMSAIVHKVTVEQKLCGQDTARQYVYRVMADLKARGITPQIPRAKPGLKREEEATPLSETHRRVGYRLNFHRTLKLGLSLNDFCVENDYFSPRILRRMELGTYDFTLTDLARISELLGLSLIEITAPTNIGATCQKSSNLVSISNT